MSRQNKSKYALLGMLTLGPMSGYDIKKLFDESLRNFWTESYGQIYPILKQLVETGWATQRERPQTGKPARQVYSITPKGRTALRLWLVEPVESPSLRLEILLKLFFGPEIPVDVSRKHVAAFRAYAVETLDGYRRQEKELKSKLGRSGEHPGVPYWLITLDYGQIYFDGIVTWCDRTLKRLSG